MTENVHQSEYGAPILVVGMPRSGTTWLAKLFDSHPYTLYLHEPDSHVRITAASLSPAERDYDNLTVAVREYLAATLSRRDLKAIGKLPLFPKAYQTGYRYYLRSAMVLGNKLASRWGISFQVPDLSKPKLRSSVRPVWKSIEATGRAGLFARHLGGPTVLLLRHPCGQINSTLQGESQQQFSSEATAAGDYGVFEQLLDSAPDIGCDIDLETLKSLSPVARLAWRWRLINDKAVMEAERNPAMKVVLYEALCSEPESVLRELFAHCDLQVEQQTLDFIAASTSQSKSDYYSVYKNPLQSAQQWREKLTAEQVDTIRDIVMQGPAGRLFADQF